MEIRSSSINTIRPSVWMALLSLLFVGCATTYKVDPKLVSQYKAPPAPAANETQLYVIRGSNFVGGARDVWVGMNDKVVAALTNNSHVLLKVPSGINTLSIVQNLTGVAQTPVDNRSGETLFLSLNYLQGTFDTVERDLGISMVMKTKAVEPLAEPRNNDGYDDILMNPGRLGLGLMKPAEGAIEPTSDSAVLTLYRSGKLIAPVPFDVWRNGEFAASLKGGEYTQLRLPPGRHTLIGKAEQYSVLEADVQAGKRYFAQLDVGMGWNQAHIKLLPEDANADDAKRSATIAALTAVTVDSAALQKPEVSQRFATVKALLSDTAGKVESGKHEKRSLTSAMGR